jgi:hypothetical protein
MGAGKRSGVLLASSGMTEVVVVMVVSVVAGQEVIALRASSLQLLVRALVVVFSQEVVAL